MNARKGQVALYLVMVLVAIVLLMMMNVSTFLSVRSKNRMMNAADAAAIAAAKYQGDLLNRIGNKNVEHLRALIPGCDSAWRPEDADDLRELAMFGPLDAIVACQRAAKDWGFEEPNGGEDVARAFRDHVRVIRERYCNNPDQFPEYRDGQWADYAARLEALIGGGLTAAPGFVELADGFSQDPLLNGAFYDAIAAKAWCWFTIGNRRRYLDMDSTSFPRLEAKEAALQENSEIFSLHVTFRTWMQSPWAEEWVEGVGFTERWTNFVCQVAGCTRAQLAASRAADPNEVWAFYDANWSRWSTTFNPENMPLAGSVKPAYDVAGCVASCLMPGEVARLVGEASDTRTMLVTAEAKPLGTVVTPEGEVAPVTAFNSFVAPSRHGERIFTEAQLVPVHSVPRSPGVDMSPAWYDHVTKHLPEYFVSGPNGGNGCYYCRQLALWESAAFRASVQAWLMSNAGSCHTGGGEGREKGGYDWAH